MNRIEKKLYETICRISLNEAPSIDNVLQSKVKNTVTGNDVKVASALSYKNTQDPGKRSAYQAAVGMLKKAGADEKDIKSLEKKEKGKDKKEPKEKPEAPIQSKEQPKAEPKKIAATDFKTDAEKSADDDMKLKSQMPASEKPKFNPVPASDVKKEIPNADPETFDKPPAFGTEIGKDKLDKFVTDIAKVGQEINDKKARGEETKKINLCKVTIPGTNLYCEKNKGISRKEMPQFKGEPVPGSPADKMPRNKDGEVDTEPLFRKMLEDKGIETTQTEVPADRLKATQSELGADKVLGMVEGLEKDPTHPALTGPIFVSRDGYVIDGHHRWAAIAAYNAKHPDKQIPMKCEVIDKDIKDAIPMCNDFARDMGIASKAQGVTTGNTAQKQPVAEKKTIRLSNFIK